MKIMEKITKLLHNNISKKWNTLKKGDKICLLIPIKYEDTYKYTYQESEIINVKEYNLICNVRFKYTEDNGKRKRVNLAVNKLKYDIPYIALKRNTEFAKEYTPVFGDIIVTFNNDKEYINNIYAELINKEIINQENIISKEKRKLSNLQLIQYDKIL